MTPATALTLLRMLMAPVVFYLVLEGRDLLVLALLAAAAATDILDGWLARRTGRVSRLGTVLDPIADKLVVAAVLLAGAQAGRLPFWLALAYLAKEALQLAGGAYFLAKTPGAPIGANRFGKAATVLTFAGFFLLFLIPRGAAGSLAGWLLVLCGLCMGIYAAFTYLRTGLDQRRPAGIIGRKG
ncbi:MAG: CDP-alcohol phosphatidyltransferase family protein [Patescibacteria group bacterium]